METERKIETELRTQDQLINHRLSWLGTVSGFLVAAVALAISSDQRGLFIMLICFLGAFAAASAYVGTLAANLDLWDQARAEGWPRRRLFWWMPGNTFPVIVLVWWIVLAIVLCSLVWSLSLLAAGVIFLAAMWVAARREAGTVDTLEEAKTLIAVDPTKLK